MQQKITGMVEGSLFNCRDCALLIAGNRGAPCSGTWGDALSCVLGLLGLQQLVIDLSELDKKIVFTTFIRM